jgi:hypothetical protein
MEVTNNVSPWHCALIHDSSYVLPDPDWVEQTFSVAFKSYLYTLEQNEYIATVFDCENYAESAKVFMSFLHQKTKDKLPGQGIAFGIYVYQTDIGPMHAINFFIGMEQGEYKLFFFEPQGPRIIQLSDSERMSVQWWIL